MKKLRNSMKVITALFIGSLALEWGSADADVPPPHFDAEPFAAEKTPPPTVKEWGNAASVALTSSLPRGCNAYRVREWIKIRCAELVTLQLALLGGDSEGVSVYIQPAEKDDAWTRGGEIIFPVRRGDRRMFEWSTAGDSYTGNASVPTLEFLISESFAPGAKGPTIVADSIW